ncbi:MAG TPA: apolipoprotein N-acyltransferase [Cellvibrio sp.]|nr:apolipoprotein N-acyltransferase [Cellvibrio sp.]
MTASGPARYLMNPPHWLSCVYALIAGALIPLSFAPFHFAWIGILSLCALALSIHQQPVKTVLWRSWSFAVGMYATGVSWIYVSISGFGGAPMPLAVLLVSIFVIFMAAIFCLPFYIYGRWFNRHTAGLMIAFPAIWFISEWLRTWLFTGFPWLFIGYGHLHTWLAGWAPVTGVMGISAICALTAAVIAQWLLRPQKSFKLILISSITLILWGAGFALKDIEWTQASADPISIALVQPNVAQEDKWQESFRNPTLDLLRNQTEPLWDHNIIIWPEAAIPLLYTEALPFLNEINRKASDHHTGLISGIIFDDQTKDAYYNSVATFGDAIGIYHKRRLVPFGEYVPLGEWLRGLIDFFNLPTSYINLGPSEQRGLKSGDVFISPSVCYEIAYPDLVAKSAAGSQLLMSVSNLGWFGDSLGRHQFMEMAQMRALETQHYFAYSTNNGPSAIFDRKGNIQAETRAFAQETLSSTVYASNGSTPFMRWGSWPLLALSVLLLLGLYRYSIKSRKLVFSSEN